MLRLEYINNINYFYHIGFTFNMFTKETLLSISR